MQRTTMPKSWTSNVATFSTYIFWDVAFLKRCSISYNTQRDFSNKINSKTLQSMFFLLYSILYIIVKNFFYIFCIFAVLLIQFCKNCMIYDDDCCKCNISYWIIEDIINIIDTCRCKYCFNSLFLHFSFWPILVYIRYVIHHYWWDYLQYFDTCCSIFLTLCHFLEDCFHYSIGWFFRNSLFYSIQTILYNYCHLYDDTFLITKSYFNIIITFS